jgi:anti-sigma regulatory factor (Ser/Thr protein kinase)
VRVTEAGFGRELLATPAAVGLVRTYVGAQLDKWGYSGAVSDAQLVAAELVTNAVAISGWGGTIRVFLGNRPKGLVFGVWDPSPHMPERKPPPELTLETLDLSPGDFDRNGGWGLTVVEALTRDLWIERPSHGGKWVCAALDV